MRATRTRRSRQWCEINSNVSIFLPCLFATTGRGRVSKQTADRVVSRCRLWGDCPGGAARTCAPQSTGCSAPRDDTGVKAGHTQTTSGAHTYAHVHVHLHGDTLKVFRALARARAIKNTNSKALRLYPTRNNRRRTCMNGPFACD